MKRILLALGLFLCFGRAAAAQAPAGFTLLTTTTALTYTDVVCPDLTSCYYVITSVDSTGHEGQPATCATGQLCFIESIGQSAVAQMPSSGSHNVVLTWTASTTAGVSYKVYIHVGPLPASNGKATVT
jgi:hypothetical protein